MNNVSSGLAIILVGILLGILTFTKFKYFWEFFNTKLLRKWIGDSYTSIALYIVSTFFIIIGTLLSLDVIR